MTRKDYVAIAQGIWTARPSSDNDEQWKAVTRVAESIAEVMERDNSRFDRARFLAACGVQS